MIERKTGNGHYRVLLLRKVTQMRLSESTQLMISSTFRPYGKNTEALEANAKELLQKIEGCQTEEEVIRALGI